MNTLFGNNVVNNHGESKSANSNFHQSSSGDANYRNENFSNNAPIKGDQQSLFNNDASNLEPINFDDIPDFKSFEYKDGRINGGDDDWVDRKKCTMAEIEGQPIVIRSVHQRKSKIYEGNDYISINFVNKNNEECFVNTSGHTIKKQISEKNIQYPFKATIVSCSKKDNPNLKYYKLSQ